MKLLDRVAKNLPLLTSNCTWPQTTTQAMPASESRSTWRIREGRIRLHPLPSWSPESNPVELVWWSVHEAVSRNHQCAGLDDATLLQSLGTYRTYQR